MRRCSVPKRIQQWTLQWSTFARDLQELYNHPAKKPCKLAVLVGTPRDKGECKNYHCISPLSIAENAAESLANEDTATIRTVSRKEQGGL